MLIDTTSMRESYHEILKQIMLEGKDVDTRLGPSKEVAPAVIRLNNPLDALPLQTGRGIVSALAAVEALSLIAEEADPRLFVAAAPHYAKYVDPDTKELEVAYGPRIGPQMAWAEHRLRTAPDCRQAHVDLWHYELDRPGLRAYPCVTSCGFYIRDGALDMFVEMRSNDAWMGLPYDMFAFAQLQVTLAGVLTIPVGRYHHYARSLHLYEQHWPKVAELQDDLRKTNWAPTYEGVQGDNWHEARYRARQILRGEEPRGGMSLSEVAYLNILRDKVFPAMRRQTGR